MKTPTEWLAESDCLADERRRAIRMAPDALVITGTRYYVAADGFAAGTACCSAGAIPSAAA